MESIDHLISDTLLIKADWLEENGRSDEAKGLRWAIACKRFPRSSICHSVTGHGKPIWSWSYYRAPNITNPKHLLTESVQGHHAHCIPITLNELKTTPHYFNTLEEAFMWLALQYSKLTAAIDRVAKEAPPPA